MFFQWIFMKNLFGKYGKKGMPVSTQRSFPAFTPSLLASFILIIIICTFIMGILSYRILGTSITNRTISSNNKLLSQFSNSMDTLVLESINDISHKMVYDINSNFNLNCYFNRPIENNLVDIYEVGKYLHNMSISNPHIYSLSIYYKNNNLLVCTDYVRHTLYKNLEEQEDLNYYHNMINNANNKKPEDMELVFDYGKNLHLKPTEYGGKKAPETVIHAVRNIFGYDRTVNGAVVVTISGDIFKNTLKQFAMEDLGSICIIDSNGRIISHTNSRYTGRSISDLEYGTKVLDTADRSGYFIAGVEGIPSVISYQHSAGSSWIYISVYPIEAFSSVAQFVLRTVSVIGLFAIIIGLLISLLATKRLAKPLKSIASFCSKSPYSTRDTNTRNEYSLISGTLNNLQSIMEEREKEIREVIPILRVNFLNTIFSEAVPDRDEIDVKMKMLRINMPYRHFCAAAVKIEKYCGTDNAIKYEYEKIMILSRLEKIFTTNASTSLVYEKDNVIAALCNFDFEAEELYGLGQKFLDTNHVDMQLSKYLAFGQVDEELLRMGVSFRIAANGLKYSYVFPEKHLYTYTETKTWEEKRPSSNRLLLNNLENSLKSLNREKCTADLKGIVASLREGRCSYQHVMTTLHASVSAVEDFICMQQGEDNADIASILKNTVDIFEFEKQLTEVMNFTFDAVESTQAGEGYQLAKRAREFVDLNIRNSQLSLEYVARELGVSPKHLSRVFKSETGVTFVGYATNLKLNYCRNLLLNTVMRVEEISGIMGYSTPQYFISRFKMAFGCTPMEYRQKNSAYSPPFI